MNANKLADELKNITTYKEAEYDIFSDKEKLKQAAVMLRNQENEIKNLVKTLDSALEELIRLKNERL